MTFGNQPDNVDSLGRISIIEDNREGIEIMYKILIVDDDRVLRSAVIDVLSSEDFLFCEAFDGKSALTVFKNSNPDAVLLDKNMPGMDGIEVLRELMKIDRNVPVVMLTGFGDIPSSVEAMKCGARNFLTKPFDFDELLAILRKEIEISLKNSPCLSFSEREIEILTLTSGGKSYRQTADILFISENTVKYHVKKIIGKLKATNITHAAAKAVELGIIVPASF